MREVEQKDHEFETRLGYTVKRGLKKLNQQQNKIATKRCYKIRCICDLSTLGRWGRTAVNLRPTWARRRITPK